jgi:hypothetical protein
MHPPNNWASAASVGVLDVRPTWNPPADGDAPHYDRWLAVADWTVCVAVLTCGALALLSATSIPLSASATCLGVAGYATAVLFTTMFVPAADDFRSLGGSLTVLGARVTYDPSTPSPPTVTAPLWCDRLMIMRSILR